MKSILIFSFLFYFVLCNYQVIVYYSDNSCNTTPTFYEVQAISCNSSNIEEKCLNISSSLSLSEYCSNSFPKLPSEFYFFEELYFSPNCIGIPNSTIIYQPNCKIFIFYKKFLNKFLRLHRNH